MAIEFRGGIVLKRRPPQTPTNSSGPTPDVDPIPRPDPTTQPKPALVGAREGPKQAVPGGAKRLVHTPPYGGSATTLRRRQLLLRLVPKPEHEPKEGVVEEERDSQRRRTQRGAAVPALRVGEDPAVAKRADGSEDPMQRVRGPVQVGPARARIPTRRQPDVRVGEALELSPESG